MADILLPAVGETKPATNCTICIRLYTTYDVNESRLGTATDYGVAMYLLFIWIITVYANGVVLLGLARQRHPLTALDILMGNLALSNGLLAVVTYPMTIVSLTVHHWQFGQPGCHAYSFLMLFFGLIAIWTLLGIAGVFHQTIKINENAMNKAHQEQHRVWACRFIGVIYVISGMFSVLPLFGIGEYGLAMHGTSCTINWKFHSDVSDVYITSLMLAGFFVPLFGTVTLYVAITRVLFGLKKAYNNPAFAGRWVSLQHKTFCMSIAICVCMIVSWTPYAVVSMWETYGDPTTLPMQLEACAALVAKSSTAFSPLVHLWYTKKFRHWLKNFCFCLRDAEKCNREGPPLIVEVTCGPNGVPSRGLSRIATVNSMSSPGVRARTESRSSAVLRHIDLIVNNDHGGGC